MNRKPQRSTSFRSIVARGVLGLVVLASGLVGAAPAAAVGAEAVTMWYIIFNNPEHCFSTPCDEPDLYNELAQPSILHASGTVTFDRSVDFVTAVYETGDIAGLDENISLIGGPGLVDAEKAEIHLVIRTHGEPITGIVMDQVTTFVDPGCAEAGGPNVCLDEQFAIFQPGQDDSVLVRFSDLSIVDGAWARILRHDGGAQIIVRTALDD